MPLTPRRAGGEFSKGGQASAGLRAAEKLKRLHDLRTAPYASLEQLLTSYLEAGCEMFGCLAGMLWTGQGAVGTVRAVYDPGRLLGPAAVKFASACASHAGLRNWRRQFIGAPIEEQTMRGALVFLPAPGAAEAADDLDTLALMAQAAGRALLDYETEHERARAHAAEKSWNGILQSIAENNPLENSLTAIAALLQQQAPGTACSISASAADGAAIRVAPSLPAKYRFTAALELPSGTAPFPLEPRWLSDVENDPLWGDLAGLLHDAGFRGCLWMPLSAGGTRGVIALHFPAGTSCAGSECELLARAARISSIAIDQAETTARLNFDARHDRLTGLPNRFHFLSLLERALADARERWNTLALLFIDLDRFKQINDTLGHSMGDAVLKEVALRIKSLLQTGDLAARMAGDEFTIALTAVRDEPDALAAGQRVLKALREPYRVDGYELFLTASMGLSVFPQHGEDASALLRRADFAMYRAKAEGGSHIEPFLSEPDHRGLEQFELENSLRRAVEKRELLLSYQPVVDICGTLEGLEALLAWKHPKLGRLAPKQFIPIAEESGIIVPIGSWVITQACRTAARWRESGLRPVRVSVNVSALQFARSDFVETIAAALAATHFPPECLELELTETFVLRDIEESARRMGRIRDLGVSIAIDDFGTGYSSLSYLRRLPATSVKIDQDFIRDLTGPDGSPAVLGSLVLLAHSMGLAVVAEGVETPAELELVRQAGCDKVQGHLFGEALSARAAARLLSRPDPRMPVIRR